MGFTSGLKGISYNEFFLAGVLGMASFGIAANTSWSFFLDRDNGIFYEMLTYPLSRSQYLLGKVLFNVGVAIVQALVTVSLSAVLFGVRLQVERPAAAARGDGGRDGRLVFLLCDLRAADPAQRRVQHGDVGLLLRVSLCQLDVLPARAAAARLSAGGAAPTRSPGTWTCCATRRSGSGAGGRSRSSRRRSWCSRWWRLRRRCRRWSGRGRTGEFGHLVIESSVIPAFAKSTR